MAAVATAVGGWIWHGCTVQKSSKKRVLYTADDRFRVNFARRPDNRPEDQKLENQNDFIFQEDVPYLWKLMIGSVGGAALIKYGSALDPDIAKPNLVEALVIIFLPVLVSILILIRQGMVTSQE